MTTTEQAQNVAARLDESARYFRVHTSAGGPMAEQQQHAADTIRTLVSERDRWYSAYQEIAADYDAHSDGAIEDFERMEKELSGAQTKLAKVRKWADANEEVNIVQWSWLDDILGVTE